MTPDGSPDRVPRRLLGVAIGTPTMRTATQGLEQARAEGAQIAELRLDLFEEPFDIAELLASASAVRLPVIATLRPAEQGGRSTLTPAERLRVLLHAAEHGAAYVDLEWDAATPEATAAVHSAGARVIVSRHDFSGMPADLAGGWWRDLASLPGVDVVKVVGMAARAQEWLPVLDVLRHAGDVPTVAIAMGEAGLATRVLALREPSCFLTFGSLSNGEHGTAPGQIPVRVLREVYRADRVSPKTRVYGLLAARADETLAATYNDLLQAAGLDAVAVPFVAADDAPDVVSAFRGLPVDGWHVHGADLQETVGQALDGLDGAACRVGKVNAIATRSDGTLIGGWVQSPEEQVALWRETGGLG